MPRPSVIVDGYLSLDVDVMSCLRFELRSKFAFCIPYGKYERYLIVPRVDDIIIPERRNLNGHGAGKTWRVN